MPNSPALLPAPRRRSLIVTLLAWFMMLMGGLGLPISVITALMLLAGSYGTANAGFWDSCVVVLGPGVVMVTGFGLLMRWRWALFGTVVLLAVVMVHQGWVLVRGPSETKTYTTESGVKVTEMGSKGGPYALPMMVLCGGLGVWLLSRRVRGEFGVKRPPALPTMAHAEKATSGEEARGWRVWHRGRDMMFYEERVAGVWQRLDLDGEMLTGRAHHVIYFASAETWQGYPTWARQRRDEIVARVKSVFREPDYEYHFEAARVGGGLAVPQAANPDKGPMKEVVTMKQRAALGCVVVILTAVTCGMGWMVVRGVSQGETVMPSKSALHRRVLERRLEPISFWAALGVYGLIGLGSAFGAGWFTREAWRLRRTGGRG